MGKYSPQVVTDVSRAFIEDVRPHHTLIGTATGDFGSFHVMGRGRYFGSFVDALPFNQFLFANQEVSPIVFADFSVAYDISKRTQLLAGADNIFNAYPDRANSIIQFLGYKYPLFRPYEEDGGRWYVRVTQRF